MKQSSFIVFERAKRLGFITEKSQTADISLGWYCYQTRPLLGEIKILSLDQIDPRRIIAESLCPKQQS
jgi:hypothetical protein